MNLRRVFQIGTGGLVGVGLCLFSGLLLYYLPIGRAVINGSYNLLFQPRPPIPVQEAMIVAMDDDSFEHLNQPYTAPWDRRLHAKLVDRLTKVGAKAIVFDIIFTDALTNNPGADEAFAKAIENSKRVILGADWVRIGRDNNSGTKAIAPLEMFDDGAADIGVAELGTDADLFVREHFPGVPKELISSLSWAAAEFIGAKITEKENAAEKFKKRWVNYYGAPGWISSEKYYRVVADDPAEQPNDWTVFSNKVVFVGSKITTVTAGERKDEYRSPYSYLQTDLSKASFMPGVEVQATVFLNLARGDWLTRLAWRKEVFIIVAIGILFGFFIAQYHRLNPAHQIG